MLKVDFDKQINECINKNLEAVKGSRTDILSEFSPEKPVICGSDSTIP